MRGARAGLGHLRGGVAADRDRGGTQPEADPLDAFECGEQILDQVVGVLEAA